MHPHPGRTRSQTTNDLPVFMESIQGGQMIQQFCVQQSKKLSRRSPTPGGGDEVDRFDRMRQLMLDVGGPVSYSNVTKILKSDGETKSSGMSLGGLFGTSATNETKKLATELTANSHPKRSTRDILAQLVAASYDSRHSMSVSEVIWLRLRDCKRKNWRQGHKALALLDHMLYHGSDLVVLDALRLENLKLIDEMTRYQHSSSEVENKITKMAFRLHQTLLNLFYLRTARSGCYARRVDIAPFRYDSAKDPHLIKQKEKREREIADKMKSKTPTAAAATAAAATSTPTLPPAAPIDLSILSPMAKPPAPTSTPVTATPPQQLPSIPTPIATSPTFVCLHYQ
jgi:hypothetical protein